MPATSRSAVLVIVVALGVVAGVGVAARMFLQGDGGAMTADASRTAAPIGEPGRDGGVNSSPSDRAPQRVEVAVAANAASTFASLDFKPGPPSGFAIHVVDARDHRPLAGARVAVVAMPAFDHELTPDDAFDEVVRRIDADARGFLADGRGVARVEWPAGSAWVVGEAGELRGVRPLEATGRGDFELELAPRCRVVAEVVNARGAPLVGARVGWATRNAKGHVVVKRIPTAVDAHGFAALERFVRPEPVDADSGGEPGGVLGLAVPWAGRRGPEPAAFVALGDPVPATLRCVVPGEFGTIAVRVVDALGRLVDESVQLNFTIARPAPAPRDHDAIVLADLFSPSTDSATFVGGSGTFAPVPLGFDFELQARLPNGQWARGELRGPRKDGETARATLAVQGARCRVHGRLVGATNPTRVVAMILPIPQRPWFIGEESRLVPHYGSGFDVLPSALPVTEGGTFELASNVISMSQHETLALLGIDGATGEPFEASVALPETPPTADVDLGDVRVNFVAIVAAGRVLSWKHEPVEGVAVHVADWKNVVQTDAAGRFLFVGDLTGQRIALQVDAPSGHADATVAVATGTRDVEIVLERVGAIAGRVLVDRPITLIARPHGGGATTFEGAEAPPSLRRQGVTREQLRWASRLDEAASDVDRPFTFLLRPGRYDVCASLGGQWPEAALLAGVTDIEVVAGQTTCDPRLNPLDLRGLIRKWRFVLERSDGAPPPSTWLRIAAADRGDDFLQTLFLGVDGATCDSALASAWIDVACPGFRHLHELHERGDVKLVLEPVDARPLVVHVTVPQTARAGELSFRVRAEPSWTPPVDELDWFSAPLGADGTARLDLDDGEPWRIHVVAVRRKADREHRCEIGRLARALRDEDLERGTLELRLEPDDLEAAAAELELQR